MILKIARKELQLLFYSPVAWLLLVLFTVQMGITFTDKYEYFMKTNELGNGFVHMVSSSLFVRKGLLSIMQQYLYFYIPLLTMGLVSKELNSGSIKLLYSSPIKNRHIILGKFASMFFYAAIMCAILMLYVVFALFTVKDFELPSVLSGILGVFLLTCTYAAIGIFVSSLTSYQFVAAIGTFIVLMFLSMVGGWGQEYDIIRDVTWWLSINGRSGTFISGMICSEDLFYFPLVIALFLSLTIIRLNAVRQKVSWRVSWGKYLGVILLACVLGYFSSRPKLMAYYDATSTKQNTLTPQSQEVMSKMDGELTITAYVNILDPMYGDYAWPKFIQKNRGLFKRYERFKPETRLKVVYYYDSITPQDNPESAADFLAKMKKDSLSLWQQARKVCELYRHDSTILKSPEEMRAMIDLTGERTFVWQILRGNGEKTWLRTFDEPLNPFPGEAEISVALKRMTMTLPKVGFVEGYGMRSMSDVTPRGYSRISTRKDFRHSLLNQGFDAVEIDLSQGIPEDVNILTIADMREPFTAIEEKALEAYVERGGNLFILGEPRRRDVMNPLLRKFLGVELTPGTLVQYREDWLQPDVTLSLITQQAPLLSYHYGYAPYLLSPTTSGIVQTEDKGFVFIPVTQTDTLLLGRRTPKENRSYTLWNEMESLDYIDEPMTFNPEAGEVAGDYWPFVAMIREINGKEQRVVISGDADWISNGELSQKRSMSNFSMNVGTFHFLSGNEMPMDVRRAIPPDNQVNIWRTGYKIMKIAFLWLLPLLLGGTGIVLWLRRRAK